MDENAVFRDSPMEFLTTNEGKPTPVSNGLSELQAVTAL
jgi:hypothetical protein